MNTIRLTLIIVFFTLAGIAAMSATFLTSDRVSQIMYGLDSKTVANALWPSEEK